MLQVMDDYMEPVRAVPMSADSDGEYEASMYSETQAKSNYNMHYQNPINLILVLYNVIAFLLSYLPCLLMI